MSDLVERLRLKAQGKLLKGEDFESVYKTFDEAAAEIERLRRQANELEIARQTAGDQLGVEIDRLQRELAEAREFRAILEGHLGAAIDDYNEARRQAFIEAAEIAEGSAEGSGELLASASKGKDIVGALCHSEGFMTAKVIAAQLRARAEETVT